MLYKPGDCVTARRDNFHKSVMDFIEDGRKDLSPVGRLDLDTTGLLLITNDGKLAHALLSPKKHVKKLYEARVKGRVTQEDVLKFESGVDIGDDTLTKPAQLNILQAGEESLVQISITEGRYHQVKRMFLAVGKEVLTLKRLAMGELALDESLAPGECRRLTEEEVAILKKSEEVLC
jgi:16S rRNA pseudouridine516 synthase